MNEKWKRWMEVVRVLSDTPKAEIRCPECKEGMLKVKDELIRNSDKLERYIICNSCGAYTVVTGVSINKP